MTALEDCEAVHRKWLYLPDPGVLRIMLATVIANRAEGDPVWLLIVAPPGHGKTEVLNGLTGLSDIHLAATITEPALLSGTPRKERVDGSKGGLLREIGDYGILALKDFGSVLSMHRESRASVLAALREIYDGSWTRHVGSDGGRRLHWEGKLGLIAGCTPTIDGHHAVMATMGERFVLYRLPPVDGTAQATQALLHAGHEKAMRSELAASVRAALDGADLSKAAPVEGDAVRLVDLAELAAKCRSAVERDSYNREILLIPGSEAPGRLALVLRRLLSSMRVLGVAEDDAWREVTKAAFDSIPAIRLAVLEALCSVTEAETATLAIQLKYPTTTTRRTLEDLTAHGLVLRDSAGSGHADRWDLANWTRERFAKAFPKSRVSVPEIKTDAPDISGTVQGELEGVPEKSDTHLLLPKSKGRLFGNAPPNGHKSDGSTELEDLEDYPEEVIPEGSEL